MDMKLLKDGYQFIESSVVLKFKSKE